MKRRATGLSVRFLKVKIPLGTLAIGNSTGKIFSSGRLVGNLNTEAAKIVRRRPVAKRPIRTSAGAVNTVAQGYSTPLARKASIATDPIKLSGGGSTHGSFISSASLILRRRTHGL